MILKVRCSEGRFAEGLILTGSEKICLYSAGRGYYAQVFQLRKDN